MSAQFGSGTVPETVIVPLSAGHSLEVDVYTTSTRTLGPQRIAVLCHPWSWLGGCKDDPVLESIAVTLNTLFNMHVFVPNTRSVGNSTGRASFSGKSEATDLEELTHWCISKVENTNCVIIVGYSHGSLLASCHPVLSEPIQTYHILLSYPLSPLPLLTFFNASTYRQRLSQLVRDPRAHVLILFGDRDQFTATDNYQSWAEDLRRGQNTSANTSNTTTEIKMIPGADHFWRGRFNRQLREAISNWLEKYEQTQISTTVSTN
ncbi:Alpha/Beta hydrolase protein [Rhizoctonia solani]|nr:Alpha/Beta hydrolase protein [Rhizoctonia solani]